MSLPKHKGRCHCGTVLFEFDAPSKVSVTVCHCAICKMTGYQHVLVPQRDVRFITGMDNISFYTFDTYTAKHMFCKTCGIKPIFIPRAHPTYYSINLRCVKSSTMHVARTNTINKR